VVNRDANQVIGYLNGKRMGVANLAGASELIASSGDLFEARDPAGVSPFAGRLDDVAIWNRPFSDAQVAQLFAVGQQGKSFLDGTAFPGGGNLYAGLIGTDVFAPMKGVNTSCYIRIPFMSRPSPPWPSGSRFGFTTTTDSWLT
jgi:hypothetical protein